MSQTARHPLPLGSWLMLALTLLALALRAYRLDFQSLWSDEGISLLRAQQPISQLLREMPVEHAPGYFVLLHGWVAFAGESDYALRFPSLWAGVLALPLLYRLGADLGSRRAGAAAAFLFSVNPFQVWYAQEARMYSWVLASALVATWAMWRLCASQRARLRWGALYALSVAAVVYLHHYGALTPLAHAVCLFIWSIAARLAPPARRAARDWLAAVGAAFILYLPWLPRALGILKFPGWRAPADPWQIPGRYLAAYTLGDAMPAPWRPWLMALYLALAAVGVIAWRQIDRRRRATSFAPSASALLLAATLVPWAAAFALALRDPDFHERYTIAISGPLLLLIAGGVALVECPVASPNRKLRRVLNGILPAVILAGLLATSGAALHRLYTDSSLHKPDYRAAASRIAAAEQPGDIILVDGPDPQKVFLHYYHGPAPVHDLRALQGASKEEVDATLSELTRDARRAWGIRYFHPPAAIQSWLARHGWPAAASEHNGIHVTLYGLEAGWARREAKTPNLNFGPSLTLTEVEIDDLSALRAGDLLRVTTHWYVRAPLPDLKFSLRLQDASGRVWAAEDYVPRDWFSPTSRWKPDDETFDPHGLLLPPDLPPGRYRVTLRLYDATTLIPLTTAVGDDVTLAEATIGPRR